LLEIHILRSHLRALSQKLWEMGPAISVWLSSAGGSDAHLDVITTSLALRILLHCNTLWNIIPIHFKPLTLLYSIVFLSVFRVLWPSPGVPIHHPPEEIPHLLAMFPVPSPSHGNHCFFLFCMFYVNRVIQSFVKTSFFSIIFSGFVHRAKWFSPPCESSSFVSPHFHSTPDKAIDIRLVYNMMG
jgi:hypothetical protein